MPAPTPTPAPELADPVRTSDVAWIPNGPGKSFRPLRFEPDGWSEPMPLESGSLVARHRHTGEVHAFTLSWIPSLTRRHSAAPTSPAPNSAASNRRPAFSRDRRPCTHEGNINMTTDAGQLAASYFDAWQARDEHALSEILAEDVTFHGPLGTATGRAQCVAGLLGMLGIVTDIEVHARVADGNDVITWFDLHTTVAPPTSTANWSHVENGRIIRIRVAFDPREILAGHG